MKMHTDFNREDILQCIELEKVIDTENIPFEKLMDVITGFICDELVTEDNFKKLGIDSEAGMQIKNHALQGKAFLNETITKEELAAARESAWAAYDGFAEDSAPKNLMRVVVSCLFDREAAEYDIFGSGMMLEAFFAVLLDLGEGYCTRFRQYVQQKLTEVCE